MSSKCQAFSEIPLTKYEPKMIASQNTKVWIPFLNSYNLIYTFLVAIYNPFTFYIAFLYQLHGNA